MHPTLIPPNEPPTLALLEFCESGATVTLNNIVLYHKTASAVESVILLPLIGEMVRVRDALCTLIAAKRADSGPVGEDERARWAAALEDAREMVIQTDVELTSAYKQAAADQGVGYGPDMGRFIAWAEVQP